MLFRESLLVHCDNETKNLNASVCVFGGGEGRMQVFF